MRRILFLLFIPCLAACNNDMTRVQFFNRQVLPSQTISEAHVLRSESGKLQLQLDAPFIEQYQTPEEKTVYPRGLFLQFFNDDHTLNATLRANYGISLDKRNIMMVRDSVVVIDYSSGDTIYLKDMVWNADQCRVFSNKPVCMVNGGRVTLGSRFVSDDSFENIKVYGQHGTFEFEDEEEDE